MARGISSCVLGAAVLLVGCAAEQVSLVPPSNAAARAGTAPGTVTCADPAPGSLARFRPALAPFGAWVEDPQWGQVWVPADHLVGTDFQPYLTDGRWAKTVQNEWFWMNQLRFMDATFHYGRWVQLEGGRWAWIAGSCYADAWVAWRTTDVGPGYIGWTPLWPSWFWRNGRAMAGPSPSGAAWTDCPVERAFDFPARACAMSEQEVSMVSRMAQPYRRATWSADARLAPQDGTPHGPIVNLEAAFVVDVRPQEPPFGPVMFRPGTSDDAGDLAMARRLDSLPLDGFPGWRPSPRSSFRLSTGGQVALFSAPCGNDLSTMLPPQPYGDQRYSYGWASRGRRSSVWPRRGFDIPPRNGSSLPTRYGAGATCGGAPVAYTVEP